MITENGNTSNIEFMKYVTPEIVEKNHGVRVLNI